MFENKLIKESVHATRFIMSWVREGGKLDRSGEGYDGFRKWLKSLELSDEEIYDIMDIASNGKLELETLAKNFIKSNFIKA